MNQTETDSPAFPRLTLILLAFGFVLASTVLWLWFFSGDSERDEVWQPGEIGYSQQCGEDCIVVRPAQSGRHGSAGPLLYDPKVDDAVAKWGDCIASVMHCVDSGGGAATCIDNSACPSECIDHVREQSDGPATLDAFETVFIENSAVCRPEPRPQ